MAQYIIWLTASIATGALGVELARVLAVRMKWYDLPNNRSFHSTPIPNTGGWGFLLPVLVCLVFLEVWYSREQTAIFRILLIPSFAVALLSFFDDCFGLPRSLRFLIHIICSAIVLAVFRETWIGETFPLIGQALPAWLTFMLLVVWVTGLTNAFNFMDGIDGIAATQAVVAIAGWTTILTSETALIPFNQPFIFLLIAISGGCIGFIIFNWSPATIFMGDAGSTFLGFFLGILPIAFAYMGMPLAHALEAAVLFTWPFIFDTGLTFVRRLIQREQVFDAHRSHIYQLFASTFSDRDSGHRWTTLLYGTLSLLGIGLYKIDTTLTVKLTALSVIWALVVGWTFLRVRHARRKTSYSKKPVFRPVSDHSAFDIFLSPPEISNLEYQYVSKALDSGYIAPVGPQLNAFEQRLADYTGLDEMHAVSSGTAAIHLGLRALGVGRNDCVLCPDMTFIASCNPIRYLGAEPVLVDVSLKNWAMDPELLKKAINSLKREGRTIRAMVIVHSLGIPAPMQEIMSIAREEEIPVLEDCAGAFGTRIGDVHVGGFGDAAAFSFNGNKILTTSGGGALYIRDKVQREAARSWANQGKRHNVVGYEHESLGYNYKLSNISAAIGLAQLETVGDRLNRKRELYAEYLNRLKGFESVLPMPDPDYGKCNYWLSNIGFGSEKQAGAIVKALRGAGIEASPLWKPMHLQGFNNDLKCFGGDSSVLIHQRFITLPSGTQLAQAEIDRIIDVITKHLPVA